MSVGSVLASGRRAAIARMLSTATIRRMTGRMVQDEGTGLEVPEWADVHVDLPCRIAGADRGSSQSRTVSVDGGEMQVAARIAHFPHDVEGIADGDLIDVTAGESAGQVLRVIESDWADQQTARRFPVLGAQRPSEWG